MIRLQRSFAMLAAGALLATSTVATAGTRPGSSVPAVSAAVTQKMGARQTKRVKAEERLTGTALALAILIGVGASAVAIAQLTKKNDSRG